MTIRRSSKRAVAYHEAGHACAAWVHGWQIVDGGRHASPIERDDGLFELGRVRYRSPVDTRLMIPEARRAVWRAQALEKLVFLAAGPIAQRLAVPRSRDDGGLMDRANARSLAILSSRAIEGERDLRRWARREGRALVLDHWPLVSDLAALFEGTDGLVSGQEIEAVADRYGRARIQAARQQPVPVIPTADQIAAYEGRRLAKMRGASRRDIADAALMVVASRLGENDQAVASLMSKATEHLTASRGLDPDAVRDRLAGIVDRERRLQAWRPVRRHNHGETSGD